MATKKPIVFEVVQPNRLVLPPPLERPLLANAPGTLLSDLERYDSKTLFYDVWIAQDTLWLIGPPLLSLETTPLSVQCNGQPLELQLERVAAESEKLLIWHARVPDVRPLNQVLVQFGDAASRLELAPYEPPTQARRILTTLQKDNRVEWIADWIAWYAHHYAIDAVVLYDNASAEQQHLPGRLANALQPRLQPCSLQQVSVVQWNAPYGLIVNFNHANFFCQHGSLNHCPRRFARRGDTILNFDIDELLFCKPSLLASIAEYKLLSFDSYWVPMPKDIEPGYSFATFKHRERKARGTCHKYAVLWQGDQQLCVHYVVGATPHHVPVELGYYLHYRGISTFWKEAVMRVGAAKAEAQQRRAAVNAWLLTEI